MPPDNRISATVAADQSGTRLDRWLATLPGISSRSRAARLIEDRLVLVNGAAAKASHPLQAGDLVQITLPEENSESVLQPYEIPLDILHEDEDVLVVNKPAGLVVHPAAGHETDTLVNALVGRVSGLSMGFGEKRPGIVHRIDKETSGLLVVAKNDFAQDHLVSQFKSRSIHRLYEAVCFGSLRQGSGTVQSWLARHSTDRKRFASKTGEDRRIQRDPDWSPPSGKWAVTHYKVLSHAHGLSLVELKLETGRTHQIRIHLSEEGHPLVGDHLYGSDKRVNALASTHLRAQIRALSRFLLHAKSLGFRHPRTEKLLQFTVDWPDSERSLLKEWGLCGEDRK